LPGKKSFSAIWNWLTSDMVAKVEWHPGELCPRVGFIVTNLARLAERVVAFYNRLAVQFLHTARASGIAKR
jgi:hypothetical protein